MYIELTETLSEQDNNNLFHWHEQVFPIEGKGISWSKSTHSIVCRDENGSAIGHIGYRNDLIVSAGQEIPVIGVGSVVVRPEYQGQGIPFNMFDVLHKQCFSSDQAMSAHSDSPVFSLFCPERLESYYAQHGYKTFTGNVNVMQKGTLVTIDFSFMLRGLCQLGESIDLVGEPW